MKGIKISLVAFMMAMLCLNNNGVAQSPADELMMSKKEICLLVNYEYGQFDQYWEGDFLRKNATIATVQRRTLMSMAAYGISDRLNMYLSLPYVSTNSTIPNGGKFAGTSGFQDLSIGLKYLAVERKSEKSDFSLFGSLLISTPSSDYLSDYQPYSLGLGTPQLAWRAIAHYQLKNGLYSRFSGAYVWRGYTKAEREYYYNNGSYYTPWMDVPSSLNFELAIGKWIFENKLRIETSYLSQTSLSGDDIREYNAPQPTNKVNIGRLGMLVHYYFPDIRGLGLLGTLAHNVSGKNAPKMTSFGIGVTYQFGL